MLQDSLQNKDQARRHQIQRLFNNPEVRSVVMASIGPQINLFIGMYLTYMQACAVTTDPVKIDEYRQKMEDAINEASNLIVQFIMAQREVQGWLQL